MKKLLIILVIAFFYACDSNEEERTYNYIMADGADFTVSDTKGVDLLDPKNANHIKESDVKIFYLVKGVKEEVYNGLLIHPRNFLIHKFENEEEYHITVFLNSRDKANKTTTYIQWNEKDCDTIEATFFKNKDLIFTKDIWYNKKLVFTSTVPNNTPFVRLIK